jgi:membrane associated rhomboid family serine protease
MLPLLCLIGVGISYLLLTGMSVKRKKRPRLLRLALELGVFGAIIGWLTAWAMLHPWTEAHVTRFVPVRLFALPLAIISAGPGLVAKWILRRSLGWRPGAPAEAAQEIIVAQYLIALALFCLASVAIAARQ